MGIKSNRTIASYFNRFGTTGLDAVSPVPVPVYTEATGGIISDYEISGSYYRTHVFTSSGTFTVTQVGEEGGGSSDVEYIVVGGGGGANCEHGGGGAGAGGYLTSPLTVSTSPGSYAIQIGGGGLHTHNDTTAGLPGSPSYFTAPLVAYGGGGGASKKPAGVGGPGGSGGGDGGPAQQTAPGYGYNPTTPSPVLPTALQPLHPYPLTQGYPGGTGTGSDPHTASAGGGGAGGAGGNGSSATGGAGGIGIQVPATFKSPTKPFGTPGPDPAGMYVAGGGGGSSDSPTGGTAGTGGYGGGGDGGYGLNPGAPHAISPDAGTDGTQSTGGGGGATDDGWGYYWSGNGGSGIVAVVYEIESLTAAAKATGGAISYYGGNTIHTFTNSGNFTNPAQITDAEFVIVAGGGSGGYPQGGGGGAGGMVVHSGPFTIPAATNAVVIGAGGNGSSLGGSGGNGSNSTITFPGTPVTYSAYRGGAGGNTAAGQDGGSGGGGSYPGPSSAGSAVNPAANPGATEYGNAGAAHAGGPAVGGGGGGSGAAAPGTGGVGGIGRQLSSTYRNPASATALGTPGPDPAGFYIAGGGAGFAGHTPGVPANAVAGGGGGGPYSGGPELANKALMDGKANTGGGGVGPTIVTSPPDYYAPYSGSGGSGIVLIAYPT